MTEEPTGPQSLPCPSPTPAGREKRRVLRFDKLFAVAIAAPDFGETICIGRNISQGGMFVETREPMPLGSRLRICFSVEGQTEISALGEVRYHYFLNFSDGVGPASLSGMGIRFVRFEDNGETELAASIDRMRRLH